jgi:hypothetical protein
VRVFILIGSRVESAGLLFSARAYSPPDATWVTGRMAVPALMVRVVPAACAGLGSAPAVMSVRTVRVAADTALR